MDERLRKSLLAAFVVGLGVSITLSELALAALAIRWAYRVATGRAKSARTWPLAVPFAAFIATSLVAIAASPRLLESVSAGRGLLLIATFYVLLDALPGPDSADRFMTHLFFVLAAVSVLAVAQVALCPYRDVTAPVVGRIALKCARARGFYSIYMTLAGVLSLVLLTILPRVLPPAAAAPFELKRWRLPAWLLGAAAFGLTQVRGAWVGLVVGIAVLAGLLPRGRAWLLGGAAVVVTALLLLPAVRHRAESFGDPNDPTARERVTMWSVGRGMARDHPWTGVGPGQVKHEYARYAPPDALHRSRGHLHNTPLQILAERGVFALAAWLSIFVLFFARAARILAAVPHHSVRDRALVSGSVAAIAAFLAGGLTEYNFGDSEVVLVAYAVMALPFVVERSLRAPAPAAPERAVRSTAPVPLRGSSV